jgi:RNA polymerase sigma factor (sigma-70 family)
MVMTNDLSEKSKADLLLLEQARNGNERAFASLLNRYRDSVYYMLLKMVSNPIDAEDLTIEAFGKAFRNLDSYTPSFAFSTWLFKIATNNCIDFIRKKRTSPSLIDQLTHEGGNYTIDFQSDMPDPEELLINHQKITALREIVNQLKPNYRTLIELRYFKEYSYEEIAAEKKIPIGTVKAQLSRAKALLYNILKKTGTG